MDLSTLIDIDRQVLYAFNGSDSLFMDGLMMTLTGGVTWVPFYLILFYLVVKNNETMAQIFLLVGCSALCILLADGMADGLVKPWVARLRPANEPEIKYIVDVVDNFRGTSYSFFSAHAANTFALATFFSLVVRSRLLNGFVFAWALLNCYTRLYLGVHYPSDVLVGIAWGAVAGGVAYLVYRRIYRKMNPVVNYVSSQYTSTGYSLADIDMVIAVMVFTVAYAVLRAAIVF